MTKFLSLAAIGILAAAVLAGCASAPEKPAASAATFYPPPPGAPRIQHLATFTNERDVGASTSSFVKFIAGDTPAQSLQQPYGVALYDGRIYVADSRAPGLAVFDLVNRRFSLIQGSGAARLRRPINVTIDRDGTKYVTDTGRDQVLVFDRSDRFVTAFGESGQFKPVDTAVSGDRLYVVDVQHNQIQVLDKRTGKPLFRFGKPGSAPGELFQPTNIALDANGDVYVVETGNFRVQRFSPEGKALSKFGEVGTTLGSFARPKGIALDNAGRIYVGDAAFENVQVFDPSGRLLLYFGQPGPGEEGLSLPAGVSIDYDNVALFRRYADPKFAIEYLILVASQFGPNKVDVFGFGKMSGVDYPADDQSSAKPAPIPVPEP